jgi:uncharacterized protein
MQPVGPRERIAVIDALRGVALIGIIVANMRGFNSPMEVYMKPDLVWDSNADLLTQAFIDCFVSGKFITIFAILFGLGFAIQLTRAGDGDEAFVGAYARRLGLLLVFGAAHVFAFWWGDILLTYAAIGFLLLAFQDRDQDTLMLWTQMLYWVPLVMILGFAGLALLGGGEAPDAPKASLEAIASATRIYTEGSSAEMLGQRLEDWTVFNASAPIFIPRLLGFFVFGLWLWRTRLFQEPERFLPKLRRLTVWFLVVGLAGNVIYSAVEHLWSTDPMAPTPQNLVMWIAASFGIPALSLFYGSAVILLFQTGMGRRLLQPFTYVGRMALTNYVAQSAICTWIFYGWGLGYFGKVGPLTGLLLAVGIYAVQVLLSALWLRRFRYGPLEWLWRALTYMQRPPAGRGVA